jgi:hypothetical protein
LQGIPAWSCWRKNSHEGSLNRELTVDQKATHFICENAIFLQT